jgi:hypothetical protein
MLNGINNNDLLSNTQLDKQNEVGAVTTNPIKNPYSNIDRNLLIDETAISSEAVNLYEKEQDVKKFNTLAMSDPSDLSHEEIIANLFSKGGLDPLADNIITQLSANEDLLRDVSL